MRYLVYFYYQEDFLTPMIFPWLANSLKQIRQSLNFLMYPPTRPQSVQRLYTLVGW